MNKPIMISKITTQMQQQHTRLHFVQYLKWLKSVSQICFFCWTVCALFRIYSEMNRQGLDLFIFTHIVHTIVPEQQLVPSKAKGINNGNSTRSGGGKKVSVQLKISLLSKKIQFILKKYLKKNCIFTAAVGKRPWQYSGESEGRQKECLGGKRIKNFKS